MKLRLPLIVSLVLVGAMAALSAWAWRLVPDTARIAVHFAADGTANGFAGKTQALVMMPLVGLGVTVLFAAIPHLEPRRFNLTASAKFYGAVWIGVVAVLLVAHAGIVLGALHVAVKTAQLVIAAAAVLFVVIGNYLGKTRANFIAGIRTPWTLSSDYSWEKTHRLTGRLFVLTGVATLLVELTASPFAAITVMMASASAAALTGVVASYFYWRRDPARHANDGVPE